MNDLKIEIYADGADLADMISASKQSHIKGLTTNPTLMRKAGVEDYEGFARKVLQHITTLPISFEVFSDEFDEMERQARLINSWGPNVYVKIPITNTRGASSAPLIRTLAGEGIKLNVTALLTVSQVREVTNVLNSTVPAIVSVFAGRIADTGVDPLPLMRECLQIVKSRPLAKLLWASPRELLNIVQADQMGCHIITVTTDLLKKLPGIGKDLAQLSLETVKMFYDDAQKAGYHLTVTDRV